MMTLLEIKQICDNNKIIQKACNLFENLNSNQVDCAIQYCRLAIRKIIKDHNIDDHHIFTFKYMIYEIIKSKDLITYEDQEKLKNIIY